VSPGPEGDGAAEEEVEVGGDARPPDGPVGSGIFDLDQVRRFGKYASHHAADGTVFEYDQGRFWVRPAGAHPREREQVADHTALPEGPWRHSSVCGCRGCVPRSP